MLSTVLTYIALIGSTLIAIDKIFTVLIKPRKWFKAREDERNRVNREKEIEEIKKAILTSLESCESQKNERIKEEFKKIANNMIDEVLEIHEAENEDKMKQINDILKKIQENSQLQSENLAVLTSGTKDLLGREIWKVYYKYKKSKKIPQTVKVDLDHMYADYILAKGNSSIPPIYEEMSHWEIIGYEE